MAFHAQQSAPIPAFAQHNFIVWRACAARAAAATDAVTRARFLQEVQEWTARAREAEQEEREQHGPFTAP
jgi:hypothetical protein